MLSFKITGSNEVVESIEDDQQGGNRTDAKSQARSQLQCEVSMWQTAIASTLSPFSPLNKIFYSLFLLSR